MKKPGHKLHYLVPQPREAHYCLRSMGSLSVPWCRADCFMKTLVRKQFTAHMLSRIQFFDHPKPPLYVGPTVSPVLSADHWLNAGSPVCVDQSLVDRWTADIQECSGQLTYSVGYISYLVRSSRHDKTQPRKKRFVQFCGQNLIKTVWYSDDQWP